MRIAYCGPVSLHLLEPLGLDPTTVPKGNQYVFGAHLIREYVARGHEVAVITTAHRQKEPLHRCVRNLSVHVVPQRRYYGFCVDAYRKERAGLLNAITSYRPDVVHAQWTYEFAHAALDSGFPSLITARDSPYQILRHMPSAFRVHQAVYGRYVLKRCRHLSTLSPYMRDELLTTYKLPTAPTVIPNGINMVPGLGRARKHPQKPFTFTCVAGWDRRKNPKTLLKAFSLLRSHKPDVRLLMIGAGFSPDGPAAHWLSRNGGVSQVEFRGAIPHHEVGRTLREETDSFVHPTREESFGMAIVEAMATRLPVVAGAQSGAVPWLLDAGRAGVLCDVDSPESLIMAMKHVLEDTEAASRYAAAAHERVKTMFSLEAVVTSYLSELSRIAAIAGACGDDVA